MAQNHSTLKHYRRGGNGTSFLLTDEDGQQFRAVAVKSGIAVNFIGYSNPSAEVMLETVEVMRALVAKYDELNAPLAENKVFVYEVTVSPDLIVSTLAPLGRFNSVDAAKTAFSAMPTNVKWHHNGDYWEGHNHDGLYLCIREDR